MFKRLTIDNLPPLFINLLLVGKNFEGYNTCTVVSYNGDTEYEGATYYQFIQDDYGIWEMKQQEIESSQLYWILVEQLTDKVINSETL